MYKIPILICEDNEDIRRVLSSCLNLLFENIYEADNGADGYKLYQEYKPKIIVTDIHMPQMDGIEFIKKVRESDEETQVIFLTSYTDVQTLLQATELKLLKYLVKPVMPKQLHATVLDAVTRIKEKEEQSPKIYLDKDLYWHKECLTMFSGDQRIELTNYENSLINILIKYIDYHVSYEDIYNYVYTDSNYSKDAISSLIKRVRKKIPSNIIKSCYKQGYKITSY
jgi:DNA-binding response OmpR family regulator